MSNESEFPNGIIFKLPRDGAPEFVKGSISIKRSELISWLSTRTEDWINLDLKVSQKGKAYAQINDWKPSKQDVTAQQNQQSNPDDDFDIPY